jgi:hypothetical protein
LNAFLLAFLLLAEPAAAVTSTPQPVTVIRAGALLDGKGSPVRRNQLIVVRGNKIESVSDAAAATIPASSTVTRTSFCRDMPAGLTTSSS